MKRPAQKRLREGFTTGAAAAAAARAAAMALSAGQCPRQLEVDFLDGSRRTIAIAACRRIDDGCAEAEVIKDAGDDPDVTHAARIGARVRPLAGAQGRVQIEAGQGVGRVTRPGLGIAVGEPAVTEGPRRMIRRELAKVAVTGRWSGCGWQVTLYVPDGEVLARKTLNRRLGIVGGLSILGTTGVVRPLSHEAYTATIDKALSVARACGSRAVVLTTGRRTERFAMSLWPELAEQAFVQMGDFLAHALGRAAALSFSLVRVAVMFGKAVKAAQGMGCTHAGRGRVDMQALSRLAAACGAPPQVAVQVACANTARHAFDLLKAGCPAAIAEVGRRAETRAASLLGPSARLQLVIFDFEGAVVYPVNGEQTSKAKPQE